MNEAEIKRGADILMMSYEEALILYEMNPEIFINLVKIEVQNWKKMIEDGTTRPPT